MMRRSFSKKLQQNCRRHCLTVVAICQWGMRVHMHVLGDCEYTVLQLVDAARHCELLIRKAVVAMTK
jgi:hypothetical protein